MKFEELYEKYLQGTCTEEEKRFVENEIVRARAVNERLLSAHKEEVIRPADDKKVKKAKKKFSLKMAVTAAVVTLVVLVVVCGAVLGGVFGTAATAAKNGVKFSLEEGEKIAVDYAVEFLTDRYPGFTGSADKVIVKERERDFEITSKLKNSYYAYSYELIFGRTEVEVRVNSRTGECRITDVD